MVSRRSTKGASKARRDHINHEIRNMRALLPITVEDQEHMSYLHSMAAICTYIRKSVLFQGLQVGETSHGSLSYEAFIEALPGFILVTTTQGRLVYVSENVTEYLGLSMIEVLQGDSIYDMVERSDVEAVRSNLETENNKSPERSFLCCMQSSRAFRLQHGHCCSMLVRGGFHFFASSASSSAEPLFIALCTPTADRLMSLNSPSCSSFHSTHTLDMRFSKLSDSVLFLLGYSVDELADRSWYSLVHPEDLSQAANSHRSLMHADDSSQVEMVLRIQCVDLSWTWIYIRANKNSELQSISCTNIIISQTEVTFLQKKISRDAFEPLKQNFPQSQSYGYKCFKRWSEDPDLRGREEAEQDVYRMLCASSPVALGESPSLFTPTGSPAPSSSPQEELSHDFLMDTPLSSPEASPPPYCSYSESQLLCHPSPAAPLPPHPFDTFSALSPCSPPPYEFQAFPSDARLVPDCLSVSDACESPADCASLHPDDFALLEVPHEGGATPLQHVPHQDFSVHPSLLLPQRSFTPSEMNQYNQKEQEEISILAQQISSLASSFDKHHTPIQHAAAGNPLSACDWNLSVTLSKCESIHDDSVLESIFKDLDTVARKSGASGVVADSSGSHHQAFSLIADSLPEEQFTPGDVTREPFRSQLGQHERSAGLHQLSLYTQSRLQLDGLAEENLY